MNPNVATQLSLTGRWIRDGYARACELLYSDAAWAYDSVSWLVSVGRWNQWRELALDQISGERVLELGFGTGHLLVSLSRRYRMAIGLDASPQMAAKARHRLARSGVYASLVQGRGEAMPWADGSFDTVVATFPAPYIIAPDTLSECARVLHSSGGRLVIVGLWVSLTHDRLTQLWPVFYGAADQPFLRNLKDRLAQHGFTSILIEREHAWARVGIVVADRCAGE